MPTIDIYTATAACTVGRAAKRPILAVGKKAVAVVVTATTMLVRTVK